MWTVNISCTLETTERIGDITGNFEIALGKKLCFVRKFHRSDFSKCLSAFAGFISVFVKEGETKGTEHSDSTIIGSTSADSDNEIADSSADSVKNHFSYTKSSGSHRIFLIGNRDPGSRSHFHDSGIGILEITIISIDRFMIRTGNSDINTFSVQAFDQGIGGSFTAVCQWLNDYFSIFMRGKYTCFDGHAGFHGSHASFQRINRNYKCHYIPSIFVFF